MEPVGALNSIRIIPARAGFTSDHPPAPVPERDHPRSRGVYPVKVTGHTPDGGSSPLARGLLPESKEATIDDGIIPARAGFTAK